MSKLIALLLLVTAPVLAGSPTARVVLADGDPELQRAVTTALAPWKLELIVDPAPIDAAHASALADARSARFVVWREKGELVVFDRQRNESEHRETRAGALDPVTAAAAALTVKTLMRLPPPDDTTTIITPPPVVTPTPDSGLEMRLQAGVLTRFTSVARFAGAGLVKPWSPALRIGLGAELGTSESVDQAGFKGSANDWAVLAMAAYTVTRGRLELEPYVAAGVERATMIGTEMSAPRDESATLAALRAGLCVRWRLSMWTIGAVLGLEAAPGTPTYTKANNPNAVIYEVPSVSVATGIVFAVDLGR